MVDNWVLRLLTIADVAAGILIDHMDSRSTSIYFTKGCITLASSCNRLVSHIFNFMILLSSTIFFKSSDIEA